MYQTLHARSFRIWIALLNAVALVTPLAAQSPEPPAKPENPPRTEPGEQPALLGEGRLQLSDDALFPIEPVNPDAGISKQALAWYMTGQLRQSRNDFAGALKAFEQALALDPDSIAVYRSLVPLAFSMNQTEKAVDYALKAVELDPDDYLLLRRLGIHMATQRNLPEAIRLLEKARSAESIDRRSAIYVTINRDLAVIYQAQNELDKSADCYAVVFEAIVEPGRFDLDTRFRRALAGDPATSLERMGQVFAEAERFDLAVRAFEQAARTGQGGKGSISFNLAVVYRRQKEFDKALAELQKYFDAQLQTRGEEAYVLLADLLTDVGREGDLLSELEKLAEKDPRNITLQFFLASKLVASDQLERAEELYRATLRGNEDSRGYLGLMTIYRKRNDPAALLPILSKAARGDVDTDALQTEIEAVAESQELMNALLKQAEQLDEAGRNELGADGYYLLAKMCLSAGRPDDTTRFFQAAVEQNPPREKRFLLYEEFGNHLLDIDDYPAAARIFQTAVDDPQMRGQRPMLLFRLSQARELNGQTDEAIAAVLEARKILPDVPLLHYQEAWIYYHAELWDKAIAQFERVIERFPQETETVRRCQFSLSNIYVQQGDIRKGEEILEKVLAEDPDDPSVNNDLGYLYADQNKNLEKAESMIRKAVTAEPDNAAYQDSMGWVLYRLGRFEEALEWLKKATESSTGGDETLWDHLGDCYESLDKQDLAVDAWKKALESARKQSRPDEKLIKKLEEKLNK